MLQNILLIFLMLEALTIRILTSGIGNLTKLGHSVFDVVEGNESHKYNNCKHLYGFTISRYKNHW